MAREVTYQMLAARGQGQPCNELGVQLDAPLISHRETQRMQVADRIERGPYLVGVWLHPSSVAIAERDAYIVLGGFDLTRHLLVPRKECRIGKHECIHAVLHPRRDVPVHAIF